MVWGPGAGTPTSCCSLAVQRTIIQSRYPHSTTGCTPIQHSPGQRGLSGSWARRADLTPPNFGTIVE